MKALILIIPDQPEGPSISVEDGFEVMARRDRALIVKFEELPECIDWLDDCEMQYCELQDDEETFRVIREATLDELIQFRVPRWIQHDNSPDCCGRRMHFVGQIDDDEICSECPDGAEYWWHDRASFYVFTCSKCLDCKSIGQQC